MKRARGITLAELVVSIGIIGLLSFLLPLLIKLFNNMGYLQQKSLMQKEAKAVLWQMSHDVANAAKIIVDTAADPNPDCLMPGSGNCLQIFVYDFEHYRDGGKYEDPNMYLRTRTDNPLYAGLENCVQVFYEVIQESLNNKDYNKDGTIQAKPYLLKSTAWDMPWPNRPGTDVISDWSDVIRANTKWSTVERRETFLKDRVVRNVSPATFSRHNLSSQQLYMVTLKLKSSYDKAGESPRYFSSLLSMTGQSAW